MGKFMTCATQIVFTMAIYVASCCAQGKTLDISGNHYIERNGEWYQFTDAGESKIILGNL